MRILFAALKYDYGIEERGYSFEYYSFYDTLVRMGYEVEYFDFYTLFKEYGSLKMTQLLREKVEEFKPDLLFSFLYSNEFDFNELLRISKETKTVTYNWFADDHWRFDNFSRHWAWCFKFVSTTDRKAFVKYKAMGFNNVLLTQWAANTAIWKKSELEPIYDVTFIGQLHGNRRKVIKELKKLGVEVKVWGPGWAVKPWHSGLRKLRLINQKQYQKIIDSTRLSQDDMIRVLQRSKISINLTASSQLGTNQIKGRNFEIPACGRLQISDYADYLEEYFEYDKEIVVFNSLEELAEKIKYYLTHDSEREEIALSGYKRVLKEHTYEHRFRELFKQMGLL